MRVSLPVLMTILACFGLAAAAQQTAPEPAPIEQVDERTDAISKTLRCVVCQNQSIYDSNAPLAEDMRRLVRKRVEAGDSNAEAREYLRNLYGDYVLMSPPLQMNTVLLWVGPLIFVGLGGLWFLLRLKRAAPRQQNDLSEADRARIAQALRESQDA